MGMGIEAEAEMEVGMEVLIPFSANDPKSRLADTLSASERAAFADAMLADVLEAVVNAGGTPHVLSTAPIELPSTPSEPEPAVTVDDRPLTEAVNGVLTRREPTTEDPLAVVVADLALVTPAALGRLFEPAAGPGATARPGATAGPKAEQTASKEPSNQASDSPPDVIIAPGRGGGTNALVVRHPAFRVDYHGASYLDHQRAAADIGATVRTVDSHRLATDIDERDDLAEVVLHSEGAAARWLETAGFTLHVADGRVGVVRG